MKILTFELQDIGVNLHDFNIHGLQNLLDLTKYSYQPSSCIDKTANLRGPKNYFDSSEFSTQPTSSAIKLPMISEDETLINMEKVSLKHTVIIILEELKWVNSLSRPWNQIQIYFSQDRWSHFSLEYFQGWSREGV